MLPLFIALAVPLTLLALLQEDRHSRYLLWFFCWGVGAGLLANFIETPLLKMTGMNLEAFSVQIAPPLEELIKVALLFTMLLYGALKPRDEKLVLYAISAGIGFSVIENFFYLSNAPAYSTLNAAVFVLVRSLSTTIMHGLATGFLGLSVHLLYGGMMAKVRPRWPLLFQAYALAVIFHALFNLYVSFAAFGPAMAVIVSLALYAGAWMLIRESGLLRSGQ